MGICILSTLDIICFDDIIIDREAGEIIRLVASVHLSVRPSVRPSDRPSVRPSVRPGVQNGCVCNLLLFRHVWRLRSITLLIRTCFFCMDSSCSFLVSCRNPQVPRDPDRSCKAALFSVSQVIPEPQKPQRLIVLPVGMVHSLSKETQLFFMDFSWDPGSGSCDPGS